jgi:hypothetical protein
MNKWKKNAVQAYKENLLMLFSKEAAEIIFYTSIC